MTLTVAKLDELVSASLSEIERYSLPLLVFRTGTRQFQTATGTLIRLDAGVALVTAAHVLRQLLELGETGRLQIGGDRFVLRDVHKRPINFGVRTDLATMVLSPAEVAHIGWDVLHAGRLATKNVREYEYIAFMGFPGVGKRFLSDGKMALTRHECIAVVETVEHDQFSIRIDAERYEYETNISVGVGENASNGEIENLGGISGAPIFSLITGLPDLTIRRRPKLIGWVSEGFSWSKIEGKVYAVKANALNLDGTIVG